MESDATKEKPPMVEEGSRCSDDDNGDYDSDGDGNGDYDGDGDGDGDGALNKLPPDCRDRVFLFLSLSDCLRFAETSRNSLAHSIAEVDRRRREQFLVRPCEEYTVHGETTTPHCAVRTPELPPGDTLLTGNNHHEDHHHLGNNGNDNDNGNGKANGREPTNKNSGADPYLFRMSYSEDLVDAFSNNQEEEEEENPRDRRRTWYELPSVLERLEGLYRAIPSTHPFRDDLRNLVAHLRQVNGEAMIVHGARGNRIDRLSEQWSSVTYAHRMHASLLQRCTVNLDPVPHSSNPNLSFTVTLERYMGDVLAASCLAGHSEYHGRKSTGSYSASGIDKTRIGNDNDNDNDNGNINDNDNDNDNVNVNDPMSDYNSEDYGSKSKVVVEGGVSLDRWMDHLVAFVHNGSNGGDLAVVATDEISSITGWYQYWVFFHSALLRVSPFSVQQGRQLLAWPLSGLLEPLELFHDPLAISTAGTNNDNRRGGDAIQNAQGQDNPQPPQQHQTPWFLPSRTYSCFSSGCHEAEWIADRMMGLFATGNRKRFGVLETTLNHFGPLGPAFRGRDRITTNAMMPHKLYVTLLRNHWMSWSFNHQRMQLFMGAQTKHVVDAGNWVGDVDAWGVVRWMKLLKDQSQKTRPMTVQPPLVTIRMVSLSGIDDAE